ncbi:amidase signature domain-containing protein [Cercophora newfieldiana]|uniref:Amidase signature domain-containing protein n=1 Tax=Cercophora newfieldiana TaxID=92897 RepID=A0AA39YQT2_9PEZI|nr:amidase signature domain-containing protein [Cercophora newfieldiana]
MADPLSIAASVTALVATARKIYTGLSGLVGSAKDAPASIEATLAVVGQIRSALVEVKELMDTVETLPPARKALIRLDHLAVTFSDGIMLLTELEVLVCDQPADLSFTQRLRWAASERDRKIARLLPRLETQRSCLNLMLSVLKCRSDIEAWQDRDRLQDTLEQVLRQNENLVARLETIEASIAGEERSTRFLDEDADSVVESAITITETPTIRSNRPGAKIRLPKMPLPHASLLARRHEFEALLESSWVYRRVRTDECDRSISSYTFRTGAWSILSELSLNDISIISVFRLPVTLDDVNRVGLGLTFSNLLSGNELPRPSLLCTTDNTVVGQSEAKTDCPVLDLGFKAGKNETLVDTLSRVRTLHKSELPTIKIVVVGDGYIGKTKFIRTYVTRGCSEYKSSVTVLEYYLLKVSIGHVPHSLLIYDTTGLEGYEGLRPFVYESTDVFVACGLIGNPASFRNFESNWLYAIRRAGRDIPAVFVGLKDPANYPPRPIPGETNKWDLDQYREFGERLEREIPGVQYMECSLGSFSAVEAVFDEAVLAALRTGCQGKSSKRRWSWGSTSSSPSADEHGLRKVASIDACRSVTWLLTSLGIAQLPVWALVEPVDVRETTIDGIHTALFTRIATCREIVSSFISRIEEFNPVVNAIISLNPRALSVADQIDLRIASGNATGPLLCIPVLLKDNYDAIGMATTGGCRALASNEPASNAPTVKALKDAGAIILGKANLHELALEGISVSSLGGQTVNPYDFTRTPGGSSGGSGAAIAANFAVFATGTDTVNSLRSPASANSLFSFRPTRGLISRAGVMPVSYTQDTLGAMARNVKDLAVALTVMSSVGHDPRDNMTAAVPPEAKGMDYSASLYGSSLKGLRFGVLSGFFNHTPSAETTPVNNIMNHMLSLLADSGAVVVNISESVYNAAAIGAALDVQRYEFRELLNDYFAGVKAGGSIHPMSFDELYKSGNFLVLPSQYDFLKVCMVSSTGESRYFATQGGIQNLTRALQATFAANDLDVILYPEQRNLVVKIGSPSQSGRNGILAALTGHPAVVVPAGFSPPSPDAPVGVPVGLEILGRPWSEGLLLSIANHISELLPVRRMPPLANQTAETKTYSTVPSKKTGLMQYRVTDTLED